MILAGLSNRGIEYKSVEVIINLYKVLGPILGTTIQERCQFLRTGGIRMTSFLPDMRDVCCME